MPGFGSPCGACKFLRRRCVNGCIFAPYFREEQGAAHFAAIHKVFGASNVSKLLAHLPIHRRFEAAASISFEDPIYGCVAHIFALQQQVLRLQAELAILQGGGILNTTGNFISEPSLSQQQKHQDIYLHHHNQQVGAADRLTSINLQDPRTVISARTWSNIYIVDSNQPQGSNYLPSSLTYSLTENVDASIPSAIQDVLNFDQSDDLLFDMLR